MSSKPRNRADTLPQVRHLTQRDLAKRWNKSVATIEKYRALGNSPRFLKIGGIVLFREEDVLEYERNRLYETNSILEEKVDDFNRRYTQLQLEGSKTALELPGVLDEVITLAVLKADDGTPYRAFVTRADNPYGFPSKDRSGRLDAIEEPDLGKLIRKCLGVTS